MSWWKERSRQLVAEPLLSDGPRPGPGGDNTTSESTWNRKLKRVTVDRTIRIGYSKLFCGWCNLTLTELTFCLDLRAHSSKVSAASNFPCLRYKAPRFLSVVVTVGLSTFAALCQPPYSP